MIVFEDTKFIEDTRIRKYVDEKKVSDKSKHSAAFIIGETIIAQQPCHGAFIRYTEPVNFFLNFTTPYTLEYNQVFLEWLLSKDSPYEKATESDNFFKLYDAEKKLKAFGWLDFEAEQHKLLCYNLLIASRLGSVQWRLEGFWKALTDAGMHPTVALRLMTYVVLDSFSSKDTYSLSLAGNQGDQPFNNWFVQNYEIKQTSLKNLLEKKFTEKNIQPRRCNNIWAGPVGKASCNLSRESSKKIPCLESLVALVNNKTLTKTEVTKIEKELVEKWL